MKKTIQREAYMAWLAQFRDKPLIKVLTGMRRVGKSTITRMFAQGLGSSDLLCYIQVAVTVAEKEKYSQEVAAFKSIRDNYPKLILTLDDIFIENHNGIQTMNVIDFITGRCTLPV